MDHAGIIDLRLPQARRLVPREVFHRRPSSAAYQFGFEMGTGARTYMPSPAPWLLVAAALLLQPPWWVVILLGPSFGLGRAALAWGRYASSDGERWDAALRRQTFAISGWSLTICSLALLAVAAGPQLGAS